MERARARGEEKDMGRDVSLDGRPKLTLHEGKEKEWSVSLSPESDDAPSMRDVSRTTRANSARRSRSACVRRDGRRFSTYL